MGAAGAGGVTVGGELGAREVGTGRAGWGAGMAAAGGWGPGGAEVGTVRGADWEQGRTQTPCTSQLKLCGWATCRLTYLVEMKRIDTSVVYQVQYIFRCVHMEKPVWNRA